MKDVGDSVEYKLLTQGEQLALVRKEARITDFSLKKYPALEKKIFNLTVEAPLDGSADEIADRVRDAVKGIDVDSR